MPGKMAWLSSVSGEDGTKILFLQPSPDKPFRPYTNFHQFKVPDYQVPGGSKGWATYQKLLKARWELVPSDQVISANIKAG